MVRRVGFFITQMKTYSEKLKDPRWQRKRLEIMERDEFKCSQCESDTETLTVHHTYYVTGRSPWMYPNWSLTTLCSSCHQEQHDDSKSFNGDDESRIYGEWEEVIGFLGIAKMEDFGGWWDISVMLAQRKDEFKERKIRPIDWLMWAYAELLASEYVEKTGEKNPLR